MSNGQPPQLPDPATRIVRPPKERAVSALLKFLVLPGARPNRNAIEAHLRNAARLTQGQVDRNLVRIYNECVALGAINAR